MEYTSDGHMATATRRPDGTYFSYFGEFELQGDVVLHHIEFAHDPRLDGTTTRREVSFEGDRLVLTAVAARHGRTGQPGVAHLGKDNLIMAQPDRDPLHHDARRHFTRGPYFLAGELPADDATRDRVLLAAMGSPDQRQIDGMGGATTLTSKVAIVSPSDHPLGGRGLSVRPGLGGQGFRGLRSHLRQHAGGRGPLRRRSRAGERREIPGPW